MGKIHQRERVLYIPDRGNILNSKYHKDGDIPNVWNTTQAHLHLMGRRNGGNKLHMPDIIQTRHMVVQVQMGGAKGLEPAGG